MHRSVVRLFDISHLPALDIYVALRTPDSSCRGGDAQRGVLVPRLDGRQAARRSGIINHVSRRASTCVVNNVKPSSLLRFDRVDGLTAMRGNLAGGNNNGSRVMKNRFISLRLDCNDLTDFTEAITKQRRKTSMHLILRRLVSYGRQLHNFLNAHVRR